MLFFAFCVGFSCRRVCACGADGLSGGWAWLAGLELEKECCEGPSTSLRTRALFTAFACEGPRVMEILEGFRELETMSD